MPTPPKTSRGEIIAAARNLLSRQGVDALTMQAIAETVGVRAPSLYKHFADRKALLREIEQTAVAELEHAIQTAAKPKDDRAALKSMSSAFRRFAREHPSQYNLIFTLQAGDADSQAVRRRALQPVLQRLESFLGNAELAFLRARVLTAFLHGFVSMETAGAFKLGGNIDHAFTAGIDLILP
jgi:AcrR family transcriptional regulator